MAVTTGTKILASEYEILRSAVNRVFADNYAGGISFGNSNQTYGWGGNSASAVSIGDEITAAQVNTLRDRMYIGTDIVNGIDPGDLPAARSQGSKIFASEYNALETDQATITSNRLSIENAECSLSTRGNSQRTTAWGSEINAIYRFSWTDFDDARYFFNSGGKMRIWGTITGYSTGTGYDGAGFNQIFTNMGTIEMDYTQTTQTGSGGSTSGTGYYNLTTSWATIFSQTGTGVYSNAVLQIQGRRSASGNYVELIVRLTPEAGRTVNGTTTVYCGQRKLNNQSYGTASLTITQPTYSLQNVL